METNKQEVAAVSEAKAMAAERAVLLNKVSSEINKARKSKTTRPEIKSNKTHSWYSVHGDCVFSSLISQRLRPPVLASAATL
eukprot:3941709-Rhodomonas_salina.5